MASPCNISSAKLETGLLRWPQVSEQPNFVDSKERSTPPGKPPWTPRRPNSVGSKAWSSPHLKMPAMLGASKQAVSHHHLLR